MSTDGDVAYDYSIDDPAKNSKRTLAFVLVVIIHVLFFWVLASGLGAKVVEVVMGPVETKIIDEKPDEDKPPPPPPEMDTPPPYVPPPEVSIEIATDTGPTTAITNVTSERPVAPARRRGRSREHTVVKTLPSTQGKGARITQPEYPPASRRAGEAGTVTLTTCVLESGRSTRSRSSRPAASTSWTRPRSRMCSATGASCPARKTESPFRCGTPSWSPSS